MDTKKAHKFIEENERHILEQPSRFTVRQIALFKKLAGDLDLNEEGIPMLLIHFSLNRLQELEELSTVTTLN